MDFQTRRKKLRKFLEEKELDAFLITDPWDIFYYTGYRPGQGFLLVTEDGHKLFLSTLENEAEELKGTEVEFFENPEEITKKVPKGKIGFDERSLKVEAFDKLESLKKVKWKKSGNLIRKPRLIKEPEETQRIKKAVKIIGKIFSELEIQGKTEIELSREIDKDILDRKLEKSFPPIVASGPNSYYIHHRPGKRKIQKKDLVIIDLGVRYKNYCSDITRTYCQKPNKREQKLMQKVEEIQEKLIQKIKPGAGFKEIQNFYKELLKKGGYKLYHSFGHSIGLEPHEGLEKIEKNMVLSVEPGIYVKGLGGCRKEDLVLVKEKTEVLQ